MAQFFLPVSQQVLDPSGRMTAPWWSFFQNVSAGITSVDLATQVTGILSYLNGGTGHSNLQFTTTGATNVTLPTSGTLVSTTSPVTAVELTVSTGVTADSGGIKHTRISTGSIGSGASVLVTVNWTTAFADAAYTVVASVLDSTAATASLSGVHLETQTAGGVKVRVANGSAGSLTGTLQVIALHD